MSYMWNLVIRDIGRLRLFALPQIFYKYDELCKKRDELWKLLTTLAEMVPNSEKQYKADDEEKQDEGSVLDDEEKQHERSVLELKKHERIVLELWLEELQDAFFNTEDLVDKIHTEALRHKFDRQICEKICEKMEDIRCSLESCVKQGDVLGLAGQSYNMECLVNLQGMHHPDNLMWHRIDDPNESAQMERPRQPLDPTDYIYFVDESEVFGMDCDKEKIIKLLLSDDASDRQLSVISIEGNGRIGKTTLARLVYNEQRVSHHFHLKAWVHVPDDFDRVTRSILNFFILKNKELKVPISQYNDLDKLSSDELGLELQQCLVGKRFLLVLDGAKQIPSSKGWKALQYALKDAANGSCIIVTTRKEDTVQMMNDVSHYRMEPLSEEKCWSIFAKFAFGDQNPTPDAQLEVIGKEIVQMCHGLPSSVRILGSLLRFKLQREEWEAILERLTCSSDSREDSRENVNVVPNLRLPEDLKRCLAYCSIFPQDYEIEKEKLVLLCMAEGILELPSKTGRLDISRFINKLKPFLQKSSRSESSFRMCTNNLAAYVSTRYCFRLEDNHPSQIPLNTRYLSLVGGKYENSVIFEAADRAKLLRTFLPLDHESRHLCATELQNLLSKLQFLRVLSLSHFKITEIPNSIGNLEHLRYIDLSHTPIKRLPESVCELYNLQSLILSNCHSLTELPENTLNLENLLNLDVSGSGLREMPKDMRKLRNLKLLPCFVVGKKSGSALGELHFLKNLEGTLHISKLQNVASKHQAVIARLCDQRDLRELVLEWDENTADPKNAAEVLEGLQPAEKHLEKLTIKFYNGKEFAGWFKGWKFDCIFSLRLSNCKNCSSLPSLRNLPSLRVLIIECMDAVEEMGPDFSSKLFVGMRTDLERLTFDGMSKWTKWVPPGFPHLQQLCIRRCPKLRGNLPKELRSVERVEISESQELVTALKTEASLNNLHYREKIVVISDDKVTSFTSEGAAGSSSLRIEALERLTFEGMSKWTMWVPLNVLPRLQQLCIRRCPKLRGNLPMELPLVERVEFFESQELVTALKTEASLNNLHYREKIVFISDDKVTSFTSEGKVTEKPREIEERGETEEETDVEIPLPRHATESSSSDIPGTPVPITQRNCFFNWHQVFRTLSQLIQRVCRPSATAQVSSTTLNEKLKEISGIEESEADVLSDTWSNSFESTKVSAKSELMALPTPLHSLKIEGCDDLTFIPKSVIKNPSLQHLYIVNCCSLESFPYKGMALKILYIRNCKKLYFPLANENIQLGKLEDLSVGSSCDSLTDLSLHLFPELRSLSIWDCAKLQKLSMPEKSQMELPSLEALEIRDCPNLKYFPTGGLPTPNLKAIWLSNCKSLNKLPDQFVNLKYLTSMFINDCPELESLSTQVWPLKLSLLRISSCNKLISGEDWGLRELGSLCLLDIEGECKNIVSFPVEGLLPSNLSSLRISGLLNLKKLDNTGLKQLESLKTLEISCCGSLQSLPEDGFPSSLSFLCIKECPLLKPKLQNENGEDWYKIAHISCIEIDEEVIS